MMYERDMSHCVLPLQMGPEPTPSSIDRQELFLSVSFYDLFNQLLGFVFLITKSSLQDNSNLLQMHLVVIKTLLKTAWVRRL